MRTRVRIAAISNRPANHPHPQKSDHPFQKSDRSLLTTQKAIAFFCDTIYDSIAA
ncbi:MAG: hypothetical protein ACHBN1_35355 [Heteroscytonema crispum UTEX LB 1556]